MLKKEQDRALSTSQYRWVRFVLFSSQLNRKTHPEFKCIPRLLSELHRLHDWTPYFLAACAGKGSILLLEKWRFVYSRRRLRGRVFRCKRLNTDTYGVATNGTGGTTILMSGSAPRATASTAARPRFVKCSWVLSRGRKCNRPVISVAPSHLVTVAITWNFLGFFFTGKQQFSFLVSRACAVWRPSPRVPRTLRISEAARCADPLRDYIIMRRHCTLG